MGKSVRGTSNDPWMEIGDGTPVIQGVKPAPKKVANEDPWLDLPDVKKKETSPVSENGGNRGNSQSQSKSTSTSPPQKVGNDSIPDVVIPDNTSLLAVDTTSPTYNGKSFIDQAVPLPNNGKTREVSESTRLPEGNNGEVVKRLTQAIPYLKKKAVREQTVQNLRKKRESTTIVAPIVEGSKEYEEEKQNVEKNIRDEDVMPSFLNGKIRDEAVKNFAAVNNEAPEQVSAKLMSGDYIFEDGKVKLKGGIADNFLQGAKDALLDMKLALDVAGAKANKDTDAAANNEIKYHINEFNNKKTYDNEYTSTEPLERAAKGAGGFTPYLAPAVVGGITGIGAFGFADIPAMGLSNMGSTIQEIWHDPRYKTDEERLNAIHEKSNDAFMIGAAQAAGFHGVGAMSEAAAKPSVGQLLGKYQPTSKLKYSFAENLYNNLGNLIKTQPKEIAASAANFGGTEFLNEVNKANSVGEIDLSKVPQAALAGVELHLMMQIPKVLTGAYRTIRESVKTGYNKINPDWFNTYNKQTQDALNDIVSAPENVYREAVSQLDNAKDPDAGLAKLKIETFRGYYNSLPETLSPEAKAKALHILQLKTEAVNSANNSPVQALKKAFESKALIYDSLLSKLITEGDINEKAEPLLLPRMSEPSKPKEGKGAAVVKPEEVSKPNTVEVGAKETPAEPKTNNPAVVLPEINKEPNIVPLKTGEPTETKPAENAEPSKKDLMEEAKGAVADIKPMYRDVFLNDTETSLKEIAQQLNSSPSEAKTTRKTFGDKVSDIALKLYPDEKVDTAKEIKANEEVEPTNEASTEPIKSVQAEEKQSNPTVIDKESEKPKEEVNEEVEINRRKELEDFQSDSIALRKATTDAAALTALEAALKVKGATKVVLDAGGLTGKSEMGSMNDLVGLAKRVADGIDKVQKKYVDKINEKYDNLSKQKQAQKADNETAQVQSKNSASNPSRLSANDSDTTPKITNANTTDRAATEEVSPKQGLTEVADLNKMYSQAKLKYGDKKGREIYEAANRLVNPNENTIVDIKSNGVTVKEGDNYTFKPFGNTDANSNKWTLYKGIDVTDQYKKDAKSALPEINKSNEQYLTSIDSDIESAKKQLKEAQDKLANQKPNSNTAGQSNKTIGQINSSRQKEIVKQRQEKLTKLEGIKRAIERRADSEDIKTSMKSDLNDTRYMRNANNAIDYIYEHDANKSNSKPAIEDRSNEVYEYKNKKSPLDGQRYEVTDVSKSGGVTLAPVEGKTTKSIKLSKADFERTKKQGYYVREENSNTATEASSTKATDRLTAEESKSEKATQGSSDRVEPTTAKVADAFLTEKKPATPRKSKLRDLADKIEKDGIPFLNKFKADLPEGTERMGFNLDKAVADALRFIDDAIEGGKDVAKAIEEGFEKIRQHYKDNNAKFKDEAAFKNQFEEFVIDNVAAPLDTKEGNWSAIRKEKLSEIEGVKAIFEKETNKSWTEIQQQGLEAVAKEYPDKNLYEAVKAKTEEIAAKYDNKIDYNPTAKDLAVIQEFKRQTQKKINQAKDRLDSDNDIVRRATIMELEAYNTDLQTAAKAFHTREAGTAFGFRQSESLVDADYGLHLRRMELMKAKNGEHLSPADEAWVKEQWDKEKAILQEKQELREKGMQEAFDQKIADLQKEYEAKLQIATKDKPSSSREKTLSQKGKDVADIIRKLKTDKNSLKMDFTLGGWNIAVEGVARLVESGATIAEAIKELIDKKEIGFKTDKDQSKFENSLISYIENGAKKEGAFEDIKKIAEADKVTELTKDMVAKGLVRDFVNSHIGEVEQKDVLGVAAEALRKVLPDVTKKQLIEAYLKEGDFHIETKKELEGSLTAKKRELQRIATLESDIADLEGLKVVQEKKVDKNQPAEYEKELLDKKKALLKEYSERRLKIIEDNRKLESAKIKEDKAIQAGKDKLAEINANIERAKKGMDIITTHRNKSTPELDAQIEAKRRELRRAISENSTDEQQQASKLEKAKKKLESDIKQLRNKIDDKNYDEPAAPTGLRKADAELIKLQREHGDLEAQYRKKQHELMEKNKSGAERAADFARSLYVSWLIGAPKTFAKIASMSMLRPMSEAATKQSLGRMFDAFFPSISEAARRGGESSSLRSTIAGFSAYFKQMGEAKVNEILDRSNVELKEATDKYEAYKNEDNHDPKRLKELEKDVINKQLASAGNLVYQFIGGSSLKDSWKALVHRANVVEQKFGGIEEESFKDGNWLDKTAYVINFFGRSHSALKTFSGRFSFAAGFMARMEAAVKDGEMLTGDRILEIGHESYLDFERGKYQQENAITRLWNKMVNTLRLPDTKYPEFRKVNNVAYHFFKADVAITRVPVNILHEAVMEYTLGTFRALRMAAKEVGLAKTAAKLEGLEGSDFKDRVKQIVSQMDEKQAATIARCFRKGGFGLGMYALFAITGMMHFGGYQFLGQRRKKDEEDLAADELNPAQVEVGGVKLGETLSGVLEHIPALWTTYMGLGMAYTYHQEVAKGKSTMKSAWTTLYNHLKVVEGGIPQSKIVSPIKVISDVGKVFKKRSIEMGMLDDSQIGVDWDGSKEEVFLRNNKLKVTQPKSEVVKVPKSSKHPNGKLSNAEYGNFIQKRADKIKEAVQKALRVGLLNDKKTKEENQKELTRIAEQASEWAKQKLFGKHILTPAEKAAGKHKTAQHKRFDLGLFH